MTKTGIPLPRRAGADRDGPDRTGADRTGPDRATEIASQHALLRRFNTTRVIATVLASTLMAVFLPLWIVLVFFCVDYLLEAAGLALMNRLDPAQSPRRYGLTLFSIFLLQASYLVPVAMIWFQDSAYSKSVAVGLVCMTLFQLASVRAIHLPFGMAGLFGVLVTTFLANLIYWLERSDQGGLATSSFAILGAIYYAFAAMRTNHMLHREISRRGHEADLANQSKGRFLASISHELRTPLNAILGMGAAELTETDDPRTKERMQVLVAAARELGIILDDVLDMTALGEGALPIRPREADPCAVIAATAALFQPMFDAAGLDLRIEAGADLPARLLLDPNRLRQCLSNLMSNALKFTESGGVTLRAVMVGAEELQIDVINTGPALPPGMAETIFTPFNSNGAARAGSGLGLAISRGIARRMGGDLVLLANPIGPQFRLTVAVAPAPPAGPVAAAPLPAIAGLRVLVVDDIATNRLVAATYLRLQGALPVEAASGEAAIRALQESRPDVILLDMNMPGLSGQETLAAIRALPGPVGRVKVLAMTADASDDHRRAYLAAGLDGFLAKPLSTEALAATIATVMAQPQG